jgi:hypothetical protein
MTGRSSKSYKKQKRHRLHNHSLAEPRFCLSRDPVRVTQAARALAAFVAAFCNWPVAIATLATLRRPPWPSQRLLAGKRRDMLLS